METKKYQVTKRVEKRQWEVGDIVNVVGKLPDNDVLIPYDGEKQHKHVLAVVEPATLSAKLK